MVSGCVVSSVSTESLDSLCKEEMANSIKLTKWNSYNINIHNPGLSEIDANHKDWLANSGQTKGPGKLFVNFYPISDKVICWNLFWEI